MKTTVDKIEELIRDTASTLPEDVLKALKAAAKREAADSSAKMILKTLLDNAGLAAKQFTPMCQDTGTLTFFADWKLRGKVTPEVIGKAVARATEKGYLRHNTIDSVSGKSVDSNVCGGAPVIHYCDRKGVTLIMKGGGSENMSRQYSLPDSELGAGRDLGGVRKCIVDAVLKAQGYGCAPGFIGVCIGGDRASGYECAKEQLLRDFGDVNADAQLRKLERQVLADCNSLGIGPMGLGGKTTLLAAKIGSRPRVPASFFVTVAYMCWAARRRTVLI